MSKKIMVFLFGLFLFLTGGLLCIRPTCAQVIKEAFIGRSVALRNNDVIWAYYPDADNGALIRIQEMMEEHPQLEKIAGKYLDALADYRQDEKHFEEPDVSGNFEKMNQSIIKELESEFDTDIPEEQAAKMTEELLVQEQEVVSILSELPNYIRNFGTLAWMALDLYGILTSWWLILLFSGMTLGVGWLIHLTEKAEWMRLTGLACMGSGLCLAVFLPALVRGISYALTNRLIGRAWMIGMAAFVKTGGVMVVAGIILFVIFLKKKIQPEV